VTAGPAPENGPARPGWDRRWAAGAVIAAVVAAAVQVAATYAAATHQGRPISVPGYLLLAVARLVLAARRRFPLAVLALIYAAPVSYWATAGLRGLIFAAGIAAFVTVVLARKRGAAVVALVAYYAGYLWLPVLAGTHRAPPQAVAADAAAGLAALLGVAEWLRLRRQHSGAVNRGRQEEARRRASEERMRIARELHDAPSGWPRAAMRSSHRG
jgi:signal transduction histidine kinase